jgi:hypothetical protein
VEDSAINRHRLLVVNRAGEYFFQRVLAQAAGAAGNGQNGRGLMLGQR